MPNLTIRQFECFTRRTVCLDKWVGKRDDPLDISSERVHLRLSEIRVVQPIPTANKPVRLGQGKWARRREIRRCFTATSNGGGPVNAHRMGFFEENALGMTLQVTRVTAHARAPHVSEVEDLANAPFRLGQRVSDSDLFLESRAPF